MTRTTFVLLVLAVGSTPCFATRINAKMRREIAARKYGADLASLDESQEERTSQDNTMLTEAKDNEEGKCKRSKCTKSKLWGVPAAAYKKEAQDKCQKNDCAGCTGCGEDSEWCTVPDCVTADAGTDESVDSAEEEFGDFAGFASMEGVQADFSALKGTVQQASDPAGGTLRIGEVAAPVCDGDFVVDAFQRNGKEVKACRNKATGRFAKNLCCEAAMVEFLKKQENAAEACGAIGIEFKKYCKPDYKTFGGKTSDGNTSGFSKKGKVKNFLTKKGLTMPDGFGCQRMYECFKGDMVFGPVPSQKHCGQPQGPGKVLKMSARAVCVEVQLP